MFSFFGRRRRIFRICLEQAKRHNLKKEFLLSCAFFHSPEAALEDWDLMDNETAMKIRAEYNQLIDIELPPPTAKDA